MCALMGIILTVSTYAWFSALKTVNVSTFNVNIKTTDSLLLSLTANGSDWAETVTINEENYKTAAYPGNTNSWGGLGLIPMSSIGELDPESSTMKLYEKASLTATPNKGELLTAGGYRLLASRVPNYNNQLSEEHDGYVAFDLFIRNFSGEAYYKENAYGIPGNEEAIYLTTDSKVEVGISGVRDTGIENSVRVAFAEIGRVNDIEDNQERITGITCYDDVGVTGICRDAAIWEPNDDKHVQNAINWYNQVCMERTGPDVFRSDSYSSTLCKNNSPLEDGLYYPTYAITKEIDTRYLPNVDIYDGYYNNYYETASDFENDKLLYAVKTFTDYDKMQKGTDRKEIFYLAPNSITKVRVYVWIEGQDIDNYDFASLGKAISVGFGFEKERFTETDITGEETTSVIEDTVPPTVPTNMSVKQVGSMLKMKALGSTDNIKVQGYQYSIDNENWSETVRANVVYELDRPADRDTVLTIYTKAIDLAGNESTLKTINTNYTYVPLEVDLNPPTQPTSITVTQTGLKLNIKASGSTDDVQVKGYRFSLDNSNWSGLFDENAIYTTNDLENKDEKKTIYAIAVDTSGNESPIKTTTFNFVHLDTVAPTTPTKMSMVQGTNGIKVTAGGSTDADSGLAGYKFSTDNTNWTSLVYPSASTTISGSTTDNTFYVKAVDNVGNESGVYSDKMSINDYAFTGGIQEYTTPKAGNYILEVWGAQGGGNGGYGGYSIGTANLSKSKTVYIVVGGQGARPTGGYNGGGQGQLQAGSVNPAGYGGGGATHIALKTGVLSGLSSYKSDILIVAGGGGGGSENSKLGGSGGGTTGGNGTASCYASTGGTQTSGGAAGDSDATGGSFGQGGSAPNGSAKSGTYGAGGGGGGYYGGGGSSFKSGSECAGGGSGGSGYLSSTLTNSSMTNGARAGSGYARITYIGNN